MVSSGALQNYDIIRNRFAQSHIYHGQYLFHLSDFIYMLLFIYFCLPLNVLDYFELLMHNYHFYSNYDENIYFNYMHFK